MTGKIIQCSLFLLMLVGIVGGTSSAAQAVEDIPALAGRYESSVTTRGSRPEKQASEWFLWREPYRIEVLDSPSARGEVWQLGKDGDITHFKVYHKEKRVIEYTPGDLRMLYREPEWHRLTRVVDADRLKSRLKRSGEANALGRSVRRYKGRVDGIDYEMWWIEREQIPAMVRQVYPDRTVTLSLKELYPLSESPWPHGKESDYQHIDYADIGDKESDPFLKPLLHEDEHIHSH